VVALALAEVAVPVAGLILGLEELAALAALMAVAVALPDTERHPSVAEGLVDQELLSWSILPRHKDM
jgi:hypothetical protein